ncbi:MAG: IS1595 family transposase [Bauldia sp.]
MSKPMTIGQFFKAFPDDDACLAHLFKVRYGDNPACPKCGQIGTFHKLAKLPAYTCNCGHHIHPMVGTPFHRSRTPLQKWFFAMFMFTTTRNGVAAKELQRQLGVTYKTAWRIARLIREYMGWVDGDAPLGGAGWPIVETDEMFVGGKDKIGQSDKTIVLGMVERGGEVVTRIIPDRSEFSSTPIIKTFVRHGSKVATDEWQGYKRLGEEGFTHGRVNHSAKEYVRGEWHTNTIEGFWSMVKRTIEGTHIWVSRKHLPKYLGEIEYRWNLRKQADLMFPILLASFQRPSPR